MREFQMAFITSAEVKRWMQVLSVMEQERRFTIGELSERLAISQRTLIKDIQAFKNYFGTSIELRSNYSGYYFEERNRRDYQEKKEQLLENEVLFEIVGNVFWGKDFTVADLAHQHSYAESTLRRFLLRIRPVLADYELTLAFNPVNFLGEEANIRKFFFDFYYSSEQTPYTIRPPEDLHTLVLNELSGKLGKYELGTGITISAFYYQLYIAMVRVHQNHFMSLPEWVKVSIYQEKDFQLLYSLQERIKDEYEIYLSKEEFAWIHLSIISKRTIHRVDQEQTFNQRFNRWKDLQFIVSDYLSDPFFEQWDTDTLEPFMTSFFISRLMNEAVSPVLNKELEEIHWMVKKSDKQIYEAHKQFLLKHAQVLSFSAQYFEDIVVSFTAYMNLLFHYYQPVKKVLFLLEGDYLVVQSIRMQARVLLGEYHKLLFMPLQELTPEHLNDAHVDLIVTNYRPYLLDYALDTDCVLMGSIPTAQDWARVKHQLNPLIEHETF
ncbi:helix-turn-helix domain-containing protein [Enterococcus sp. 1001283B150225_161107_E12]|uniref:helix-turn-helix domain-containing protein n=1 Tax=Enterococcus sp. 1001283B150225_161107_E12 TaxID=2787145 RepID=UPI00189EE025|nr:helix-turn-helix domain-containing protein [Enterococcus sp. 1001283B150225_161107_E12]